MPSVPPVSVIKSCDPETETVPVSDVDVAPVDVVIVTPVEPLELIVSPEGT
jgi:hypothetical protein